MLAPIVLFVYNRPWHAKQTLEALSKNILADKSILYIYADGPKVNPSIEDLEKIKETRQTIREKQWCKEVHIIESDTNKGLADSIVNGVTNIVNRYEKIIVLEDDIVTSKGFLKYMNDALKLYVDEEKVMQISGFIYPIKTKGLPETFFYNVNSCWGWATWQRAWKYYNGNTRELLNNLSKQADFNTLDFNGGQGNAFYQQLVDNLEGKLYTWAIKWHTSMYLKKGYCLHPRYSLVRNIGHDNTGENCDVNERLTYQLLAAQIQVRKIPIVKLDLIIQRMKEYYESGSKEFHNSLANGKNINMLKKIKRKLQQIKTLLNVYF
ncbi:hypothetical protein Q0590_32340 [Rhodocytophaga aerolata]|uniref:Glycosyltransferase n=1 Tax=Rhodocytophaga aerolata TaxID=455078 RepID=A0ABT8RGA1_9BACT|nr:hypothetical protein [Rhodocytophaga aerolata]MDO1451009.1 hypothetical protein [Rhodocytophaga aerolata]